MLGVAVPPTAAAGRRVADPCIIAKATVHVFLRTVAMLFCSLLCAECGSPLFGFFDFLFVLLGVVNIMFVKIPRRKQRVVESPTPT